MKLTSGLLLCLVGAASALYSSSDDVVILTPANFQSKVINSDEIWLVEFYAPWCGHCKSLAPEWKKAAKALKGIVNVGAVDANEHQSIGGQYGVKGFPTIKVFGLDKNKPTDFQGARQAQAIVDGGLAAAKSAANARLSGKGGSSSGGSGGGSSGKAGNPDDVVELTDSNFEKLVLGGEDMWLVEFFAPWCGHCKTLAPHWAGAASELKGKVKLGALDATVHTVMASRYGVQGFPSIKYFPGGKKDSAEEYDGGRQQADIVTWALEKLAENVPAPEVVQLTNAGALSEACDDKQLCIVAVLPHILDCQSKCRNDYLKVLTQMGDKYKKRMWGWLWAEAGSQPDVEAALDMGGFGYPTMAGINARKLKYSLMKGSFSETGINEFLRALSVGRGSTVSLREPKMPSVLDTEPWDGKDGEMPVEDDYDLSDVELDDLDDVKVEL